MMLPAREEGALAGIQLLAASFSLCPRPSRKHEKDLVEPRRVCPHLTPGLEAKRMHMNITLALP